MKACHPVILKKTLALCGVSSSCPEAIMDMLALGQTQHSKVLALVHIRVLCRQSTSP